MLINKPFTHSVMSQTRIVTNTMN